MITAVSSTSAVSSTTAAARQLVEDTTQRSAVQSQTSAALVERDSAVVTISPQAASQAASQTNTQQATPAASTAQLQDSAAATLAATAAAAADTAATATAAAATETATPATAATITLASTVQSTPSKPDWSYAPPDNNKDNRVTYFEQQLYDFRHPATVKEKTDVSVTAEASTELARTASSADLKAYEDVARVGRSA